MRYGGFVSGLALVDWLGRFRPELLHGDGPARLGVNRRQLQRWRAGMRVNAFNADRIAGLLGVHPSEVWGEEWWVTP